jgi:hypothetical protein
MSQMPTGNLIVGLELCWQGTPALLQHPGFFFVNRTQETVPARMPSRGRA